MGLEAKPEKVSPQITVDAPIMIPEDYVPDLAVRMALYRRLNDAENKGEIEALAAEMIDRFGELPSATANLVKLIEIISPRSMSARQARWSPSTTTTFPTVRG
jgi:transcription-repair coupling factor (superfamily II helicase)